MTIDPLCDALGRPLAPISPARRYLCQAQSG